MTNVPTIGAVCRQLKDTAARIEELVYGVQGIENHQEEVIKLFESLLLDEVEHAQVLTLTLTGLVTESEVHTDEGSAFASGELNSVSGREVVGDEPAVVSEEEEK